MVVPYPTKTFLSTYLSIYLLNFPRMMTPGSPFILCVLASQRLPTFQCLVYSSAGHGFSHSHLVVFKCGDGFWAYSHRVPDLVDENKNPLLSNPSTNNFKRKPSDFWLLNEGKKLLPVCSVSAPRVHTCQLGLTSAFPVPKKIAQILPIFLWVNFSSPGKNVANHLSSAMT